MLVELCESLGLLEKHQLIKPEPATDDDLTLVHFRSYVRQVKEGQSRRG